MKLELGKISVNENEWNYYNLTDNLDSEIKLASLEQKKLEAYINFGDIPTRYSYASYLEGDVVKFSVPNYTNPEEKCNVDGMAIGDKCLRKNSMDYNATHAYIGIFNPNYTHPVTIDVSISKAGETDYVLYCLAIAAAILVITTFVNI